MNYRKDWSFNEKESGYKKPKKKRLLPEKRLKKLLRQKHKAREKTMRGRVEAGHYISSDQFFASLAWKGLRMSVLSSYGSRCLKCGSTKNIHVDHVLSRFTHPKLQLDFYNLQPLCRVCNLEKNIRSTPDDDHRINWTDLEILNESPI